MSGRTDALPAAIWPRSGDAGDDSPAVPTPESQDPKPTPAAGGDSVARGGATPAALDAAAPAGTAAAFGQTGQGGVTLRAGAAPSATNRATELRAALAGIPPLLKEPLYQALDDPRFVRFLISKPEVLERAGGQDPAAVQELIAALPEGNDLRTILGFLSSKLGSLLRGAGVGPDAATLKADMERIAAPLKKLGANPLARAGIELALDAGVRPGQLLRAVEAATIDPAALGRLAEGQPTARDVLVLLRALRDSSAAGVLKLDGTSESAKTLLTQLEALPGVVRSIVFGPGDALQVQLGDAEALQPLGIPDSFAGQTVPVDVRPLDDDGVRLSTKLGYWATVGELYTKSLTGNYLLDGFLRLLMVLAFPFVFLYVALSSRRVDADFKDGQARISFDHLFGRKRLATFETGLLGPQETDR